MSTALASLKFVSAKRFVGTNDPVQFRRQKMLRKLDEQIAAATALAEGRSYSANRVQRIRDRETGESRIVETSRSIRQWWFLSESGKVAVQLKYGSKVIMLSKNRNAVEVNNPSELLAVLQTLKTAVSQGELDNEIAIAADMVRARFVKK
jgi:hypothetical protein